MLDFDTVQRWNKLLPTLDSILQNAFPLELNSATTHALDLDEKESSLE